MLISDHGFGPIEHYVNFNVWLLEQGYIALEDSFYVRQKHWFYRRGVTPEWIYGVMSRLGLGNHRVSRFRGKQDSLIDRLGESLFLSRRHIDWSRTRAYAQGNFGQIFLNLKGRQPQGCVAPEDARPLLDDLKAGLAAIPHPETGEPLVEHVYERDELYHGPHAGLAPDLTVVLTDWRYRTIGLHDFTTNQVISPAFGPTGDHRMEGILIAAGPAFRPGPSRATRAARHRPDRAPLAGSPRPRRHGRPGPDRVARPGTCDRVAPAGICPGSCRGERRSSLPDDSPYTAEEDAAIQATAGGPGISVRSFDPCCRLSASAWRCTGTGE